MRIRVYHSWEEAEAGKCEYIANLSYRERVKHYTTHVLLQSYPFRSLINAEFTLDYYNLCFKAPYRFPKSIEI